MPTNRDRLVELLTQLDLSLFADGSPRRTVQLAAFLDRNGVQAPTTLTRHHCRTRWRAARALQTIAERRQLYRKYGNPADRVAAHLFLRSARLFARESERLP